jgi:GntR family transcriptional repressor for pyruvate dehydrogenase complex
MDVEPVRRAFEQVADQLRHLIVAGTLTPGTRLPLEAELAREFGVSRATVREALRSLASERLIRTTKGPGGGNFITLPTVGNISEFVQSSLALLTDAHSITLDEFLEARAVLESGAARLAAERRTDEDMRRLREAIPLEPSAPTTPGQIDYNRGFHAEVLTTARNTLLYIAAQPIFTVLQNNLEPLKVRPGVHRAIDDQHRELAATIEAGDADGAEKAMLAHLEFLRPAFERAWRHHPPGRRRAG